MVRFGTVASPSATFEFIQTIVGTSLELGLLYFAIRRRLYTRLTSFYLYIIFLVPKDILWLYIAHTPKLYEPFWAYFYWTTEFICAFLRLLIISEIYLRVLQEYSTIRRITWRLLSSLTILLFLWTGLAVWQHSHILRDFVTLGLQRMELTQTVLILAILGIAVYYRIQMGAFFGSVLAGIGIYSTIQIVVFQLGTVRDSTAGTIFDYAHRVSYLGVVVIWDLALWRLSDAPQRPRPRISQQLYDEMYPPVHDRLRQLNDRLAEMLR
jgi:hypothetical protein